MVADRDTSRAQDPSEEDALQAEVRGERQYDPNSDGPTQGPLDDVKESIGAAVSNLENSKSKE